MNPIYFFLGLLITITIMYVACQENTNKYLQFREGFQSDQSSLISQEIARQLEIDPGRIRDFNETGTPGNPAQYQIKMTIWPRNIVDQADPLINDIIKKLQKRQTNKNFFKITNSDNQDVFLSDIRIDVKDIVDKEKETEILKQFINPALEGQIQYLKDKQRGIPKDPSLDRMPLWDNGQLIIPPEPITITITPTPSANHPLTDQVTVPTVSTIE